MPHWQLPARVGGFATAFWDDGVYITVLTLKDSNTWIHHVILVCIRSVCSEL